MDVQDGIGFRPQRAEDFFGGGYGAQILRQDRDERGLGIGDERKRSFLRGIFGIRAGRACGRAAARHGDRRGEISRTARRLVSEQFRMVILEPFQHFGFQLRGEFDKLVGVGLGCPADIIVFYRGE